MVDLLERLPVLKGPHWRSGGQARLWIDPDDPGFLIKVFCDSQSGARVPRTGKDAAALVHLVRSATLLAPSAYCELLASTSWPVSLFGDVEGQIDGVRIPMAEREFFFERKLTSERRRMAAEPCDLGFLMSGHLDRPIVEWHSREGITLEDRVEVVLSAGRALSLLWSMGFVYGDVSAKNILWSLGERPRVFLIDIEGCRTPGSGGWRTDDWHPPAHLGDSVEGERCLFARLAWRVFARSRTDAMPSESSTEGDIPALPEQVRTAILRCHQSGSAAHFGELMGALDSLRSASHESAWFEWATTTGFARLVLDHAPRHMTASQAGLHESAQRQAAKERGVIASRRMMPGLAAEPGFRFDIPSSLEPPERIDDRITLRAMFENGDFELIAALYSRQQVAQSDDWLLRRAVRHALAMQDPPQVSDLGAMLAGRHHVQVDWPPAPWVNSCAMTYVGLGGDVRTVYAQREGGPASVTIQDWYPGGTSLSVRYSVGWSSGGVVGGHIAIEPGNRFVDQSRHERVMDLAPYSAPADSSRLVSEPQVVGRIVGTVEPRVVGGLGRTESASTSQHGVTATSREGRSPSSYERVKRVATTTVATDVSDPGRSGDLPADGARRGRRQIGLLLLLLLLALVAAFVALRPTVRRESNPSPTSVSTESTSSVTPAHVTEFVRGEQV